MQQQPPVLTGLNNSVLRGLGAVPIKDSTSDGTSTFSMMRRRFLTTYTALPPLQNNQAQRVGISNRFTSNFAAKNGPFMVTDNSDVVARRKAAAIGAVTTNPSGGAISFMSSGNPSIVDEARIRARYGGGAVVPKKVTQKYRFMASPPSTTAQPLKSLY